MPSNTKARFAADFLSDPECIEVEWKTTKSKNGTRRKLAQSKDPLISQSVGKKRSARAAGCRSPERSASAPRKEKITAEDDSNAEQIAQHYHESEYGHDSTYLDDDASTEGLPGDSHAGPAPEPNFKPGIFQRHPGAKASDGKDTHEYMDAWLRDRMDAFFWTILEREGKGDNCEGCGGSAVEYRCLDCVACPQFCAGCCRIRHRHDPLHKIESWVDGAWQPAWLWQVGTIICLGHAGEACPALNRTRLDLEDQVVRLTAADHRDTRAYNDDPTFGSRPQPGTVTDLLISIVHTNGFHHLPLYACECKDAPERDLQLLKAGLYPITSTQTRTVFTFQVLKHFHLMKVDSHIAVEQYCNILRRLTDDIFPDATLDRRRELTRAWQQFNYMTLLKRNGFGLCDALAKPGKGELALFCPVCPQDGVNIPSNWRKLDNLWRFWRYITADGNFVLDHLEIVAPDVAVWLTNGMLYMTERKRFATFIGKVNEKDDPGDCHELRAVAEKNKSKKGYDSTGIVAIACARHGCFAPSSVADMQKGERQSNVDYIIGECIETTRALFLVGLRLAYDINCQFSKKFRERMQQYAKEKRDVSLCPEELVVVFLIGLFHVHGHVDECLARFAPTFLPGAGVTAGEILESLWAKLNGAAGTTRNMTLALRSETLDACMGDSNRKKLQTMVDFLVTQLERAKKEGMAATEDFSELDGSVAPEQREHWDSLMMQAAEKRIEDPKAMDVFSSSLPKVEARKDVQARLMRQEREDEDALSGVAGWIALGIGIQEQQLELQALVRAGPKAKRGASVLDLERKRESIVRNINSFLKAGEDLWPEVSFQELLTRAVPEHEPCVCEELDECICLRLSAEFASNQKDLSTSDPDTTVPLPSTIDDLPPQWLAAADTEETLRVAQAHEALEALRGHIAHKSHLYREKQSLSSGARPNRKSFDYIGKVEALMRLEVKRYELARVSLMRLNALQKYPQFQEIHRIHTRAVVSIYNPNCREQSKAKLSWIWKVVSGDAEIDDAYVRDLYRVNWMRARSRRDRWNEEIMLIQSEMEWFVRFARHHYHQAQGWAAAALTAGHKAYALRQARMWLRVGNFAKTKFLAKAHVMINVDLKAEGVEIDI